MRRSPAPPPPALRQKCCRIDCPIDLAANKNIWRPKPRSPIWGSNPGRTNHRIICDLRVRAPYRDSLAEDYHPSDAPRIANLFSASNQHTYDMMLHDPRVRVLPFAAFSHACLQTSALLGSRPSPPPSPPLRPPPPPNPVPPCPPPQRPPPPASPPPPHAPSICPRLSALVNVRDDPSAPFCARFQTPSACENAYTVDDEGWHRLCRMVLFRGNQRCKPEAATFACYPPSAPPPASPPRPVRPPPSRSPLALPQLLPSPDAWPPVSLVAPAPPLPVPDAAPDDADGHLTEREEPADPETVAIALLDDALRELSPPQSALLVVAGGLIGAAACRLCASRRSQKAGRRAAAARPAQARPRNRVRRPRIVPIVPRQRGIRHTRLRQDDDEEEDLDDWEDTSIT